MLRVVLTLLMLSGTAWAGSFEPYALHHHWPERDPNKASDVVWLIENVPEPLFTYYQPSRDADTLVRGEPLLVIASDAETTEVLRMNGERATVPSARVGRVRYGYELPPRSRRKAARIYRAAKDRFPIIVPEPLTY